MSAERWLREEVELLRAQNADLRAKLQAILADYAVFALPGDECARLTPTERTLVKALADRSPRIVSKLGLFDVLYALRPGDVPEPKILDVLVCKIRPKLVAHKIETHFGIGWSLHPVAEAGREVAA